MEYDYTKHRYSSVEEYLERAIDGAVNDECDKLKSEYNLSEIEKVISEHAYTDEAMPVLLREYAKNALRLHVDEKKAVDLLTTLSHSDSQAEFLLAKYYEKTDSKKYAELLVSSAKKKNANAIFEIGLNYFQGKNCKQDYEKAFDTFTEASKMRHFDAVLYVGICFYFGYGVEDDTLNALRNFRWAKNFGNPKAYYWLGRYYWEEKENGKEAISYLKLSQLFGDVDGLYILGRIYFDGDIDVEKDVEKGLRYLSSAAECNCGDAQVYLGDCYFYGKTVEADRRKALHYYLPSAHYDNNAYSQFQIGKIYEEGVDVDADLDEAKKWYASSAKQGYEDAVKALERLK